MRVGVPKEIKDNEFRVGLVPSTVRELTAKGHEVLIERNAGVGAGFSDADYQAVGAEIVPDADQIFGRAELVVKVKEPLAVERKKLRPDRFCSPISIWPPIASRPTTSSLPARSALPTKP